MNMWILSVVLGSVLISGLLADVASDLEECKDNVDLELLENLVEVPAKEELETLCPMFLGFLDCIDDVLVKHTGLRLEQLAEIIPDPNVKKGATILVNIRNVFGDLCTDGSDLNTEYKKYSTCLSGIDVDANVCSNNALAAYEAYKALEDTVEEDTSEDLDKQCLTEAYKSACVASQVHQVCGQEAFEFYQTVVKRSNVFRLALCSEEDLVNLKTKFLDSLDLEDDHLDVFRLAFDLRKRRK